MANSNLSDAYINQGLTAVNGRMLTWITLSGGGPLWKQAWFLRCYRIRDSQYGRGSLLHSDPAWCTFRRPVRSRTESIATCLAPDVSGDSSHKFNSATRGSPD